MTPTGISATPTSVTLTAGDNAGIQATLRPDDGGESIGFGPVNYGPKTLPAGTFDTNIFVNTTGEVDKTFTPRLYKID